MLRKWGSAQKAKQQQPQPSPPANEVKPSRAHMFDPEVIRLEEAAHRTRMDIHRLKEHGRQVRQRRLLALDAMEMRRVTLTAVLKRMDTELNERDVYEYGDVLASVFGERKIYAHRAIGLEALLCQFMHQMLAKQHQLKIMKIAAKSTQTLLKKHKTMYREEYYSYDAIAIQLEASRMMLEKMYTEVFTAQHKLLAKLLDHTDCFVDRESSLITSPPISPIVVSDKPSAVTTKSLLKKIRSEDENDDENDANSVGGDGDVEAAMDILSVSTLAVESEDGDSTSVPVARRSISSCVDEKKESTGSVTNSSKNGSTMTLMERMQKRREASAAPASSKKDHEAPFSSQVTVGSYNDDASSLSHHSYTSHTANGSQSALLSFVQKRASGLSPPETITTMTEMTEVTPSSGTASARRTMDRNASNSDLSARERRRRIEKMRLASGSGGANRAAAHIVDEGGYHDVVSETSAESTRHRLRELEELQQRKSRNQNSFNSLSSNNSVDPDSTPKRATRVSPQSETKAAVTPPPASSFLKTPAGNGTPETARHEDEESSSSYETDTGSSSYETDTGNGSDDDGKSASPQDLPDVSQQEAARSEARQILDKVNNKIAAPAPQAQSKQQQLPEERNDENSESSSSYESYYTEASDSSSAESIVQNQ